MARKQNKVSGKMLFTWFMLGGFILLFAPHSVTNKFQFAFSHVFKWPLNLGRNISLAATRYSRFDGVSRAEEKLQTHIANLNAELVEGRRRFERLYGLHNSYVWDGVSFVLADVITSAIDQSHSELVIGCGENRGLSRGQFVLGDNSIIGTIVDVSANQAKVRLISDPASILAVKVGGLDAVLTGAGKAEAKIKMLKRKHKIKLGENVFAQRKSGYLDAPMKAGTIVNRKVDAEFPLCWDITVKPACDLESVKDVAVIIMNPPE